MLLDLVSLLHLSVPFHFFHVGVNIGAVRDETLATTGRRDEDIEPPRHYESANDKEHSNMAYTKTENM